MITRAEKAEWIGSLSENFSKSKAAFVVDYTGMNVEQMTSLRKTLAKSSSEIQIVRNTLAKLALKNHPDMSSALDSVFEGTNAVVFAYDDASASAKSLTDYMKDVEKLKLKAGVMEGKKMTEDHIKALANLPSKDVLRAQLLSVMLAPATSLVRVLNAAPSGFLNVMNAYKDKKGQ